MAAPPAASVAGKPDCTVLGGPGRDELVGTSGDDVICGRGGDDHLVGGGGDDELRGGDGDDELAGGPGRDVARGEKGKDVLTGGGGDDTLRGGKGNDQVDGQDGAGARDVVRCGSGKADRAFADTRHDVVSGCEVVNQNDPPSNITLKPKTLTENSPVGTLVGKLKATDADPGDRHTFALVGGKGAGDNSSFTIDGKRLLTAAAVDFEADPTLSIRVRAQDIAGARYAKSLTVSVTDVAETPTPTPPAPCTNGTTIGEGAGRTFSEPGGGEYYVHNNNWNDNYGGTHVITACNYDNWYVTVNIPDHGDNAVEAYPNVHRDYDDIPLANISSADFAGVGPKCAGCIYNTAFDIWIGDGLSHELMIWTENWGQRPAGNQIATSTIGGHTYQVWRSGSGDGGIFTYVSVPEQLSGNMPLNLFFADVRARGWTPTTTWQVDFGVETVDTNGTNQRFTFTDFHVYD